MTLCGKCGKPIDGIGVYYAMEGITVHWHCRDFRSEPCITIMAGKPVDYATAPGPIEAALAAFLSPASVVERCRRYAYELQVSTEGQNGAVAALRAAANMIEEIAATDHDHASANAGYRKRTEEALESHHASWNEARRAVVRVLYDRPGTSTLDLIQELAVAFANRGDVIRGIREALEAQK